MCESCAVLATLAPSQSPERRSLEERSWDTAVAVARSWGVALHATRDGYSRDALLGPSWFVGTLAAVRVTGARPEAVAPVVAQAAYALGGTEALLAYVRGTTSGGTP